MAACKLSVTDDALRAFVESPVRMLERHRQGGPELAFEVRTYSTFKYSGLMAVARMASKGTENQKTAIGQGLAMAAGDCLPRDPETAHQVADVVRGLSDPAVTRAYLASTEGDDRPPTPPRKGGTQEDRPIVIDPTSGNVPLYEPLQDAR